MCELIRYRLWCGIPWYRRLWIKWRYPVVSRLEEATGIPEFDRQRNTFVGHAVGNTFYIRQVVTYYGRVHNL